MFVFDYDLLHVFDKNQYLFDKNLRDDLSSSNTYLYFVFIHKSHIL